MRSFFILSLSNLLRNICQMLCLAFDRLLLHGKVRLFLLIPCKVFNGCQAIQFKNFNRHLGLFSAGRRCIDLLNNKTHAIRACLMQLLHQLRQALALRFTERFFIRTQ